MQEMERCSYVQTDQSDYHPQGISSYPIRVRPPAGDKNKHATLWTSSLCDLLRFCTSLLPPAYNEVSINLPLLHAGFYMARPRLTRHY
jgi:hypothetical protein